MKIMNEDMTDLMNRAIDEAYLDGKFEGRAEAMKDFAETLAWLMEATGLRSDLQAINDRLEAHEASPHSEFVSHHEATYHGEERPDYTAIIGEPLDICHCSG